MTLEERIKIALGEQAFHILALQTELEKKIEPVKQPEQKLATKQKAEA